MEEVSHGAIWQIASTKDKYVRVLPGPRTCGLTRDPNPSLVTSVKHVLFFDGGPFRGHPALGGTQRLGLHALMLNRQTVLVLGAGASVDFKLPVGTALAKDIVSKVGFRADIGRIVEGDARLFDSIREYVGNDNALGPIFEAGQLISHGLPLARSIDDFLYNHGEREAVVLVGKAAIAACILEAEHESRLKLKGHYSSGERQAAFHGLSDTWLYKLFGHLWSGVRPGDIDHLFDKLAIINFNYDRCVEQFFIEALQVAYSVDEATAARAVKGLRILHPYGQVGSLPWQGRQGPKIEFGPERSNPTAVVDVIKTFTEQTHKPEEVEEWRELLRVADQVVFLGFAFHKQNMDLLNPGQRAKPPWPKAYATAFGTSPADRDAFSRRIHLTRGCPPAAYSDPIITEDSCASFIDNFGIALAD